MIRVRGTARIRADFEVELDMTEEEFDALPSHEQDDILDSAIDWHNVLDSSETDDFEIDDVEEVEDEQSA
jgi:hypothetical protein